MKKIVTIVQLSLYLFFAAGVTVKVHSCSGHTSAQFALNANDPCADGNKAAMPDMCCKLELKTSKIDDEQLAVAQQASKPLSVIGILPVESFSYNVIHHSEFISPNFTDTSPPPLNDLNIFNSVFLI
jgi:hypothetical protein